jgi:hypothetical protein
MALAVKAAGVKPELEVFDTGQWKWIGLPHVIWLSAPRQALALGMSAFRS